MHDIHCHVLPGIDDGARNFDDSIEICRIAASQGVRTIVATPHYIDGESEIECSKLLSQVFLINQELKSVDVNLMVVPGMEVFITQDIPGLYDKGRIMTLNGKNYMLIELPLYNGIPSCLEDVIFNLEIKGIKPVIAHPERCNLIMEHPNTIYKLIEKECLIQVNSGSLEGMYGRDAEKTAFKLLEHNMVHVIASDTHTSTGRISSMKKCYDLVSRKFGAIVADDLFIDNSFKMIKGYKVDLREPVMIKRKLFGII